MLSTVLKLVLAICLTFALGLNLSLESMTAHRPSPSAFPPEQVATGYPLNERQVAALEATGDPDRIRAHGWAILEHFTSGGAPKYTPAWVSEKWPDKCDLLLFGNATICKYRAPVNPEDCAAPSPTGAKPSLLMSPTQSDDAEAPPSAQRQDFASVLFNRDAANFIRIKCLQSMAGLTALDQHGAKDFPQSAVIVKAIWQVPNLSNHIFLVDSKSLTSGTSLPIPPGDGWLTTSIDLTSGSACSAGNIDTTKAVPLSCFYHRSFPCTSILAQGAARGGTCANVSNAEAILVGVHIITAEQGNWVWTTFWWTADAAHDFNLRGQTDTIKKRGPWARYAMGIILAPPDSTYPNRHIAFNPYLEGMRANGFKSNCMYCHQMAVLTNDSPPTRTIFTAGQPDPCVYQRVPTPVRNCAPLLPATIRAKVNSSVHTHFIWSLANAHDQQELLRGGTLLQTPP